MRKAAQDQGCWLYAPHGDTVAPGKGFLHHQGASSAHSGPEGCGAAPGGRLLT